MASEIYSDHKVFIVDLPLLDSEPLTGLFDSSELIVVFAKSVSSNVYPATPEWRILFIGRSDEYQQVYIDQMCEWFNDGINKGLNCTGKGASFRARAIIDYQMGERNITALMRFLQVTGYGAYGFNLATSTATGINGVYYESCGPMVGFLIETTNDVITMLTNTLTLKHIDDIGVEKFSRVWLRRPMKAEHCKAEIAAKACAA